MRISAYSPNDCNTILSMYQNDILLPIFLFLACSGETNILRSIIGFWWFQWFWWSWWFRWFWYTQHTKSADAKFEPRWRIR